MVDERRPSAARVDPVLALAAGVVSQGVKDYTDDDVVKALDALSWFLDPGGAAFLMDALDLPSDPDMIFERLAYGRHVGNHDKA